MASSSSFNASRPPLPSSSMYALPLRRIRDVLAHVVPGLTLASIEEIPSTRLPRLYNLNLPNSRQLLLVVAPSLAVRLLRHEQTLLLSEATLVYLLANMMRSSTAEPSLAVTQGSRSTELASLVPKLVKHSSNSREMGYPYTIFEQAIGSPLSDQSIYLTLPERRLLDKQIGSLVRALALVISPSGRFGAVSRVVADPFSESPEAGASPAGGSATWLAAFMSLVEGILRDGEDMSVLLPYGVIRRHFTRLSWRLSAVTKARLLVIDVGEDSNVMVERAPYGATARDEDAVRITGLRDWSQGMFGDPLLSSCFENPSDDFLAGWRPDGEEDLIEDEDGAPARRLLYKCYRAVVDVVIEHYRPRSDSSRRELDGRRRLTSALADLESIDIETTDDPKRSRRDSGSGGADTSKRLKVEE